LIVIVPSKSYKTYAMGSIDYQVPVVKYFLSVTEKRSNIRSNSLELNTYKATGSSWGARSWVAFQKE